MTSHSGSSFSDVALPSGVLDIVSRNPLPALIVEVPSERVIAVSPAAQILFSSQRSELVGCRVEALTVDTPKGALDLLVAGRLNGYEANHQFRLRDGSSVPLRTWVRTIGEEIPLRHVLFVFTTDSLPAPSATPSLPKDFNALIGTIDASLKVDRACTDCDTSSSGPMDPPPTFAFALRPIEQSEGLPESEVDAPSGETRGIDVFGSSRDLASISETQIPGISELSARELDVLTRLLAGYRVPAIAKVLFISQSTVRNHLSAIFRKLNVESQQELIDLVDFRTF